jgi:single-strand DNA-binding protein
MSQSVNKVILVGFLGASPELKFTAQGKAVATFSLAVNERWRDSEGAQQESVQWFRIVRPVGRGL